MSRAGAGRPEVIGHRGCAGLEPENTLRGFRRASLLGCDAIELDVRLSSDGVPVVIHDEVVDRTTNRHGAVSSYASYELAAMDAGAGEPIPTLESVCEALRPTRLLVQIELKGQGAERAVAEVVRRTDMSRRVRFTSFFHRRVAAMRELIEGAQYGLLITCNPLEPGRLIHEAGATTLHVNAGRIDSELAAAVHDVGARLIAWGSIEDQALIRRLVAAGVDGIGSNRPDIVLQVLRT